MAEIAAILKLAALAYSCMKETVDVHRFVVAGALMLLVVAAGFIASIYAGAELPQSGLSITVERDTYSSFMSSSVGIGLTPSGIAEKDAQRAEFVWHTDYGHFLSWNSSDSRIVVRTDLIDPTLPTQIYIEGGYGSAVHGTEVINSGEKIYWTYDPETTGQAKPEVHVTLTARDPESKKVFGSAMLTIGWIDCDMAQVIR
jgi:hypothetical protein